jgi:hypothetical protein
MAPSPIRFTRKALVGTETYTLPSYKEQEVVIGQNQDQHLGQEEIKQREEAVVVAVFLHITDRVDMDE